MKLTKEQTDNAIACMNAGYIGFVGEWRGAKAEQIKWGEKGERRAGQMSFEVHTVEFGTGVNFASVAVRVRLSDDVNVESCKFEGYQRGMAVFVRLRSFYTEKGQLHAEAESIVVL